MQQLQKHNVLLVSSGLIGTSVVSIITFTALPALNKRLTFATFCFSVAIPMLAMSAFGLAKGKAEALEVGNSYIVMYLLGLLASLVGLGALFFHLNIWAGLVFVVAGLLAAVISFFNTR